MPALNERAAPRPAHAVRSERSRLVAVLPAQPPAALAARVALALPLLAGAVWYTLLALDAGSRALGVAPAHTVARTIAAMLLAPACAGFAAALVDGAQVMVRGRRSAETWTRTMAESVAGLVLGGLTGVLQPAVWSGLPALGFAAGLGLVFGLARWQPRAATTDDPAFVPLVLLLFDEPRPQAATRTAVPVLPAREREAA